jgi:integrase/recombinase XerD
LIVNKVAVAFPVVATNVDCEGFLPAVVAVPPTTHRNFAGDTPVATVQKMEQAIDSFIRFLAVERGLSENYQLSTQRSLSEFAQWCVAKKKIDNPRAVTLPLISEYLADRKRSGLSASSIKLIVVALKIFFRFLTAKGMVERDPAEALALPRIERYLPETLNELQVEQFLEKIDTKAPHGLRDRAMIELLYASGLRISELANSRLENFNFEDRIVRTSPPNGRDWSNAAPAARFFSRSAAPN